MDDFEQALAEGLAKCKPRTDKEILELVERVLKDYGLEHKYWCEVQEVRKDLAWTREARKRCDQLKGGGLGALSTAIVTGVLVLLVLGAKLWIWS